MTARKTPSSLTMRTFSFPEKDLIVFYNDDSNSNSWMISHSSSVKNYNLYGFLKFPTFLISFGSFLNLMSQQMPLPEQITDAGSIPIFFQNPHPFQFN